MPSEHRIGWSAEQAAEFAKLTARHVGLPVLTTFGSRPFGPVEVTFDPGARYTSSAKSYLLERDGSVFVPDDDAGEWRPQRKAAA